MDLLTIWSLTDFPVFVYFVLQQINAGALPGSHARPLCKELPWSHLAMRICNGAHIAHNTHPSPVAWNSTWEVTHLQSCHRRDVGKAPGRWAWGTGSRACSAWGVLGWLQKNDKRFALILCKTTVTLFRWQIDINIPMAILLQKPPARGEGVWVPEPSGWWERKAQLEWTCPININTTETYRD